MAANTSPQARAARVLATAIADLSGWHLLAFCGPCELLVRQPVRRLADGGTLGAAVMGMRCLRCGSVHLDAWIRPEGPGRLIPIKGHPVWRPSR